MRRADITESNNVANAPLPACVTPVLCTGYAVVTTRGFKETRCSELAGWIADILDPFQAGAATRLPRTLEGVLELPNNNK